MSSYKLWYFNLTGLGEPIRYILSYGNANFEDKRVEMDEWQKYKADMPFGQMPVLEVDGERLTQSKSICRYLAKKFNLYGSNDLEAEKIDATADAIDDLRVPLSSYYWEQDAGLKAKLKDVAFQKYPFILDKLEAQAKKNNGYFVNGKISWADIYYTAIGDYLGNVLGHDLSKDHPTLKKISENVKNNAGVKAYLAKRPKTNL